METILKDEQGAEQEAGCPQRSVTSTCRTTNEADHTGPSYETVMEADSDLLEDLPTLEMLTNETINAGTQASVSRRHKETSQRSLDTSPSNDNTQGICDAAFLGELKSSPAVVEMATEERHAGTETRHPKEESETSFKELEASSDGTDEWETASEESVALDREPCEPPHEIVKDIGSYGQEIQNVEAGHYGPKTIMEEAGPNCQETVAKDPEIHGDQIMKGDTGPQALEKQDEGVKFHNHDIISVETEPHVHEKISEEDEPHAHETFSKEVEPHGPETVSEDFGLHSLETVNEDKGLHGQERVKQDADPHVHETVRKEAGPCSLKTVNEEAEPHCHQTVGEDAWPHGHVTVNKNTEIHFQEAVNKEAEPCSLNTVSKEAGPQSHETVNEQVEYHGPEAVSEEVEPHDHEAVTEDIGLHGQERVKEDADVHETVSEEAGPRSLKTVNEEAELHGNETVSEEVEPHGHEAVSEVELHDPEAVIEEVEPRGHEAVSEEVEPCGHEAVSEEVEPPGYETVSEEVEPRGHEAVSEEVELCGHEAVSEEVEPRGHEAVSEEVEPRGHEAVSEEVEPRGHEAVSEEVEPRSHEAVSEEVEPRGHEAVSEEAEPGHMKTTDIGEASLYSKDTYDDTRSYALETVSEDAEPHGRGMSSKERTGPLVHEETAIELVRPLDNETVGEVTNPYDYNADPEVRDNETVSGMESVDFDDCRIGLNKDNISAVPDQAFDDNMITDNEGTSDNTKETVTTKSPDENGVNNVEKLESVTDEMESEGVNIEILSDGTHSDQKRDPREAQEAYIETINEEVSNVYKETIHEERKEIQEVYEGRDSQEMQGIYKETFRENTLQDTNVLDVTSKILETMKEVANEERIINEPSSEEKEMSEKPAQMKSEDCERNDEFSEASRVLEKRHKLDDEISKLRLDVAETSSKHVLSEDIEITYIESTRLEEKLLGTENLVETDKGPSKDLPNVLNQETQLDLQYSSPVFLDEKSRIGSIVDTETQLDNGGPPQMEEKIHMDYAKILQEMETQSVDPENIRPTNTQNEPYYNLHLGYNAEPSVQVVSSYGQGMGEPCLPLSELLVEQSTDSKVGSSTGLQNERLDGPEPHQEETVTLEMLDSHSSPCLSQVHQSTQEILRDEIDNYKLDFLPMRLKGIGIVSRNVDELDLKSKFHDLLQKTINTEYIAEQETTKLPPEESSRESAHQETTLSDIHSATDLGQDTTTLSSETAKTTDIDLENIKLLRRQRSNTDPYLNHDQEEKLQSISNSEGSPRGRLRSVTPPCDKFTSSYAPTSTKTLEQTLTSVLDPMPDDKKSSHSAKDTSTKEHTFYPTQIFNPMLLLGHTQESGFYQEQNIQQDNIENPSHDLEDNPVFLHTHNPESVVKEPQISTDEASNAKTMPPPSVGPVWLPPHPTRYASGLNDIRSLKSQENPLMRRATIRHKKSNVGVKSTTKRFSNPNLPSIPQRVDPMRPITSNLPKIQSVNISNIQNPSRTRQLPSQQRISEETGQSRVSSSMATVREEGHGTIKEKTSNSPESVPLRGSRGKITPPSSESSQSIHRRYSTFINSSNLLYQEYSDVALNQEIQRQKPGDSPAEDSLPSSPRVRRRVLSSQESYLQRLSISSADSLWQDIPKIRDSVTFLSMTREEQKLQEAKFELIMSEALYLRSLNIAVDHFQRSAELQELLSAQDRQWLFSRLSEVRDASSDFLFDLEEEFESNMYNFQVCDVVITHEPNFRRVYLPYVTNQSYQDRTFQRLMSDTPRFQQVLAKLESDPVCQRLSLKSFLILPFQRITRLRLLLQNILKRSAPGSMEELQATQAHNLLGKLIRDCNESVQRMKDTEELILLNQKIQFECKIFPLISQSRRLVKHGEVTALEYNSKWKVSTRPVYLHLFNDCLLLSRVREGGRFVVFDHASEFRVERCEIKLHTNQKNIFRVFLRDSAAMGRDSNHDLRETEFIFRTETQSQKLRWICALFPPREEIDYLRDHGLSQMQCLKSYKARENDELSLEKADILMITQNSDDGWLRGIRLSDQQSGWLPQSNVQPISRNACIRNLQEEQRLQTARAKLQPPGAMGH